MIDNDFEFVEDAEVNQNDLQDEWIKQSGIYAYWANRYADELKIKDLVWLEKRVLKAQLYNKYRVELTVGDKAPTDTRVDAVVHADPLYEDVSRRLVEAEWRVNKCDAAKWSMEHKKKSLEKLTDSLDRASNMPDEYTPNQRREQAIKYKLEESEQFDKQIRNDMKTKIVR